MTVQLDPIITKVMLIQCNQENCFMGASRSAKYWSILVLS